MNSFLIAFAVGIGIICSLAGWGMLVVRALRIRSGNGFGFYSALGLALSTSVGGLLNLFHLISPGVVRAYLLAGLLIAAFAGARQYRSLRDGVVSLLAYFKLRKFMAFLALLFFLVALEKYATAISPGAFHPQDDYHAYFVFPVKMLQTGSLGPDPFSERRVVSSLGGNAFLDTFPLSFTGKVRNLLLMDEGVAFVILLFLLAKIMVRKSIPRHWTLITLLAASLFPAALSNITALYSGVLLLVLLFDILDRTVATPDIKQAALLAIVLASLTSLKTTFAPMAGVFFLSFFLFQLIRLPARGRTIARAVFCAMFSLILLLPWMVDSYFSSGTAFYPIFGKGFHGSRYGTYLLPTAGMGMHNLLAFADGLSNTVGGLLAAEICLVFLARRQNRDERLIELIIILNLLVDIVIIGVGTGGVQMYRYSFSLLFSVVLFLLIEELAIFAKTSGSGSALRSPASVAVVLMLGTLLGAGWDGFMADQREWRLASLKFALTGQDIVSPSEVSDYRNMQLSIPPGQKVLVRMDKNFIFDFRRNPIYVNDLPGGASLPPGIPIFKGPEALADYLVNHDIRYLAYSYGDEATFSRARFSDRLGPKVNVWLRKGAEIAFDFQDNASTLGRSRKKLFDNGKMFVLDLGAPAVGYSAATSTITAATDPKPSPDPPGPVVKLSPGSSTQALQSAISQAPRGATILFSPGTYNIATPLILPCASHLTLTGPVATPATAILAATYSNGAIFALENCTGITIQYLHFENSGAVYMGKEANSGLTFIHNQITNLHGTAGIFIDGYLAPSVVNGTLQNLVSNTSIKYNTIGDAGSCTADFPIADDDGGCAGIVTHAGELLDLTIEYNYIFHVSEGIHLEQLTTFKPGATSASCVSCKINYNYILNYHRIGIENQIGAPNNPIYIEHNVVNEPINAFYGTFAMSMACCVSGFIQNGYTGFSPSLYYNDNVTISSGAGGGGHPPYGVEFWGTGSQGLNSLVQGNFSNGYTYGFGNHPWAIIHNYICGPYYVTEGGYISDQQKQAPPAQTGNTTAPSCTPTPSIASAISPAAGSYSSPLTVSLSNSGQNTSTYYTTDGTTPVPGSGTTHLYSGPFPLSLPATVKAVGMWGVAPEPLTYPSGYGYIPSGVVTASYAISSKVKGPGV